MIGQLKQKTEEELREWEKQLSEWAELKRIAEVYMPEEIDNGEAFVIRVNRKDCDNAESVKIVDIIERAREAGRREAFEEAATIARQLGAYKEWHPRHNEIGEVIAHHISAKAQGKK